ncbi:C2H2 type zinc-finger-domain-containing protein [Immersiella caudata]|uniref:C2H2 type zinc-finger-domain-containing protein n=1 Tax=Immersiella caudata TaxID=314043 RepID=A0AA39WC88_9PEZI|nr:C2H2 type zinc-finger-domain-containing protein [Immersiella caudata]
MSHDELTTTTTAMASLSAFKLSSKQCSTCNVSFDNDGVRRAHSKAPWHVENLRRRVAGLRPIDASAFQASGATLAPQTRDEYSEDSETDASSSSYDSTDDSDVASGDAPEFAAEQCLFCNQRSASFDDSVDHMQKSHGLVIRGIGNLIVDPEALVRYFHLVIYQYRECLYCRSQRRTPEAAQQHMVGRGHCKIDIQTEDSEYRDFFDFSTATNPALSSNSDGSAVHLPSGKIVAGRAAGQVYQKRYHQAASPSAKSHITAAPREHSGNSESTPQDTEFSQVISRSERRETSLTDQLATLSISDRMSLAHLPSSEQRSALATRKKQVDKAGRAELRYRSRLEIIGNRTLQKHFVEDVRAGKLIQL